MRGLLEGELEDCDPEERAVPYPRIITENKYVRIAADEKCRGKPYNSRGKLAKRLIASLLSSARMHLRVQLPRRALPTSIIVGLLTLPAEMPTCPLDRILEIIFRLNHAYRFSLLFYVRGSVATVPPP